MDDVVKALVTIPESLSEDCTASSATMKVPSFPPPEFVVASASGASFVATAGIIFEAQGLMDFFKAGKEKWAEADVGLHLQTHSGCK